MSAEPAFDAVAPDPIVVPYGGSVTVLVTGHMEHDGTPVVDQSGTMTFTVGDTVLTVVASVDVPDFPWPDVTTAVDLADVTVTANGGGSFTISHL